MAVAPAGPVPEVASPVAELPAQPASSPACVEKQDVESKLTEETDETFQDFLRGALFKSASELWAAKYPADAHDESHLDTLARLDREGVRYRNVEALMEEVVLDEDREDFQRAHKDAFARRWVC